MNKTEQGVLQQSKLIYSLLHILWLITFCFSQTTYAETTSKKILPGSDHTQHRHITLIYSADSTLQSEIAQNLNKTFTSPDENVHISTITSADISRHSDITPELVIAIGIESIQRAGKDFSNTSKLLIATNSGEYRPDIKTKSIKPVVIKPEVKNTVLYMTQPYCRQIHFIKQINSQWHTFSYLSSQNNPADDASIQQCADKYDMATYKVVTSTEDQLTNNIKNALSHSDLILALPDKTIYNSKSVKNILLTSYRNRKPIIAFSRNFVNAGALASIQSDAGQIAHSASTLIKQYFELDRQFNKQVNYPRAFDISINRQVFRALDLPIPDIDELKQILEHAESDKPGGQK